MNLEAPTMPRPDADSRFSRRAFIGSSAAAAIAPALPFTSDRTTLNKDSSAVIAQIPKLHAANLQRLQEWIAIPTIAAENRNSLQGADHMAQLAQAAGFVNTRVIRTSGNPGVFGRLDVGARSTLAVYFMYDVKQFDATEWNSPPLEGRLLKMGGLGAVCVGRGAVNQKGPQTSFLGAIEAFRAARKRLPVNLVLICEGEEEIGSPHFGEVLNDPEVSASLKASMGVLLPAASQESDGSIEFDLGAKGIIELELTSSGERWGRGPKKDVHSSLAAQVDSPAWHLVKALNVLVQQDGHTPAVVGFLERVKPLTTAQSDLILAYAQTTPERLSKEDLGVDRWIHDLDWPDSLLALFSEPTINIEGLVAGYTGPGGKTILPHTAVAKIDIRLVPDMTVVDTLEKLRRHLARQGFADIDLNVTGAYNPTQTDPNSKLVRGVLSTYRRLGVVPHTLPRAAGSWPGERFSSPPLMLPWASFGMGHGGGEHAPDEYYLIDSTNPKVAGMDQAVASFVECLYALA